MKTVHIGVTGLRKAGKTVFLTSLINHLLEGSEETLPAFQDDAITFSARALPAGDGRAFPYWQYLELLRQERPAWPERTWEVTRFRVRLTVCNLRSHRTRRLELVLTDYPGERLLDLPMLDADYARWSDRVVREAGSGPKAELGRGWLAACADIPAGAGDPSAAAEAIESYTHYLQACREQGLTFLQPAAAVMERADAPTDFCALPRAARERAPELADAVAGRYDEYVQEFVRPFFRSAGRCNRQIVLVDVLRILRQGVHSYNDTRRCLRSILDAYEYATRRRRLSPMRLVDLFRTQIGRVAFVATKADQCPRATRGNLRFLLEELVNPKRRQLVATLPDGRPRITYCAAHRSTEDAAKLFDGREVSCLRGARQDAPPDREGPWFPGEVPPEWPDYEWDPDQEQFAFPNFRPRRLPVRDGAVIDHINLDRVFHYIIEDLMP